MPRVESCPGRPSILQQDVQSCFSCGYGEIRGIWDLVDVLTDLQDR